MVGQRRWKKSLVAALVLSAACSSAQSRLQPEDEIVAKLALAGSAEYLPNEKGALTVTGPLGRPEKIDNEVSQSVQP